MGERVKPVGRTLPRIRSTADRFHRIDAKVVAEALGAEQASARATIRGSPLTFVALRQELFRRLVSTGGRPGLEGAERRQKIPLADEDWQALEELAEGLSDGGLRPTPGQVASVLLRRAIDDTLGVGLKGPVRKRSAASGKQG